jgi:hypothetical protein
MMRAVLVHLPDLPWECMVRDENTAWLPTLCAMLEEGVAATLAAVGPAPLADGIIATGRRPGDSGLLTRQAPRPDGYGQDLATRLCLRVPALWDYLDAAQLRCALVNWRASALTRLQHGWVASDLFTEVRAVNFANWGIPPGALWPASLRDELADLRLHPEDLSPEQLSPLLSTLPEPVPRHQQTHLVAKVLSENATAHALATHLLTSRRPDCLLVRYPVMEQLASVAVVPDATRPGQTTAWGFLQLLDAFIGRLLQIADTDSLFMITGGCEKRPWWLARGPGVSMDLLLPADTRLYDVPVTLLACLGLRAPGEMTGRVPPGFFAQAQPGLRPIHIPPQPIPQGLLAADRLIEALREQGVQATPPTSEQQQQVQRIEFQRQFHLGENARLEQQPADAIQAYRNAVKLCPLDGLTRLRLCQCMLSVGDTDTAQTQFAELPDSVRDTFAARLLGADIAIRTGQPADAMARLETLADRPGLAPERRLQLSDRYGRIAELFRASGEARKVAGCLSLAMALRVSSS